MKRFSIIFAIVAFALLSLCTVSYSKITTHKTYLLKHSKREHCHKQYKLTKISIKNKYYSFCIYTISRKIIITPSTINSSSLNSTKETEKTNFDTENSNTDESEIDFCKHLTDQENQEAQYERLQEQHEAEKEGITENEWITTESENKQIESESSLCKT